MGKMGDGDNEYECQIVTRSSAIGFTISQASMCLCLDVSHLSMSLLMCMCAYW